MKKGRKDKTMTEKNYYEIAMRKARLENEAMEIIAEQVNAGYYSGMFDLLDDETGEYHSVNWSLEVELD